MDQTQWISAVGFSILTWRSAACVPLLEHCESFASCQWPNSGEDKNGYGRKGTFSLLTLGGRMHVWEWDQLIWMAWVSLERKKLVESFKGGKLDVMGLQETHIKGCGMIDCMTDEEWVKYGRGGRRSGVVSIYPYIYFLYSTSIIFDFLFRFETPTMVEKRSNDDDDDDDDNHHHHHIQTLSNSFDVTLRWTFPSPMCP